jgi:glycosyltransferase involved in cell wall biosynthesis
LDFDAYDGSGRRDDVLPTPPGRSLLALGPIHPAEGLVMLLKAFAQLGADADGWTVVIAGEEIGDWRGQIEAGVRRKGGAARVMFAGASDERMQRGWLNRASLLVAPSLRMRCPVSALQALACQVPVLATTLAAPGVPAQALNACPPDAEPFFEALRAELTRPEPERVESADRACRIARKELDWTALAARYEDLYGRLRAGR